MTTKTTDKKPTAAPRWDLDSIFAGGSASAEFKKHIDKTKADVAKTEVLLNNIKTDLTAETINSWVEFTELFQAVSEDIELVISFANCHTSADVSDTAADAIVADGYVLWSRWEKMKTAFEAESMKQTDEAWTMFTSDSRLSGVKYFLDEMRAIAKSKMPVEQEALALDLAVNGYHAWNQLYDKMAASLKVDFTENGETKSISLGQNATKLSDPDRSLRAQAFKNMTEAWKSRENEVAMMLNYMAGFRLSIYENRKWDDPLFEPLKMSRMQRQTLDTMWNVIAKNRDRLKPYIEAKKKLLGIDKFTWYDQFAPVGNVEKTFPYYEAADFIVENVKPFSSDLAKFCRMAIDKNWIEAEDRPGKRGGGYCTGMGKFNQSRIFMTYAGNYENLLTLAHELGHAYHSWILKDKPIFATWYPMNLAETASTFAEAVVTDAALKQATDKKEKLMLLEQKIQGTYTMFCDIRSRFLFESAFYAKRKEGMLSSEQLSEMMLEAQKEAFGDLLDESGKHPYFWCSKLHFYITDAPFYNFPYTFGFLFSGGIYAQALKEGDGFADKYAALLADTGSMSTEDVAQKHLGADLTKEAFWQDAVDVALADVDEFVKLAGELS